MSTRSPRVKGNEHPSTEDSSRDLISVLVGLSWFVCFIPSVVLNSLRSLSCTAT
ncbi:hypothetical protein LX32DRAFT_253177 [Colletotrichum zoysiae]|uniref:Uncharacterized protein n=1 Tax=Colletotrichum zoysiae TaxID=1216348 RepID=A0AAD9HTZ8_9PEZI|nr:hypothetical protein LX32DRAFT_253177 [Colletotrichum zoysiae]